ncbi:MAG TPA: hypothetical protein VNA28_12675 [Solirubrobacteraceae bacterium]|nr:hypothetical protein [Solirubrobacteraceae bacterium]
MVRRVAAAAIGLLVIVLLVVGINGCLNGRQEQALKDYNREVSTIVRDADANADALFETLTAGGQASTDVQSEVNQLRFRAQALTKQAEGMDVPSDMRPAHRMVLLSLSLLQESMGKIAEKLPAALSTDSATAVPAVRAIAGEFQAFDAANVVYNRRGASLIEQVLRDSGIGGQTIQAASFIQNFGWLQPSTVARRINSQAGRGAGDAGTTEPAPGLHGHGILGVSAGSLTLTPGANRIPASSNVTFSVKVANQGDNPETEVRVRVRLRGAGEPISVQKVIDQTQPKTETTVSVPLGEAPPIGEPVTISVEVLPVPGEKNTTNNTVTFPALFVRG